MLHLYGMRLTEAVMDIIQEKYQALRPELDERGRRIWAAVEAYSLGYGGINAVFRASSIAVSTIRAGIKELQTQNGTEASDSGSRQMRKTDGGRKALIDLQMLIVNISRKVNRKRLKPMIFLKG
jgi:hypothetical protein